MYKTVRHGENSLQYTILPQTEEVLNNSGLKGKGRDYSPSIHVRRSRRRSTVKYVLLIIFGIIVALALASVPLYVMNGALYARRNQQDNHEVITNAPLAPAGREIVKSRKKELKISPEIISTLDAKVETSTVTTSSTLPPSTTSATVTSEKPTTPPWTMPALRSWKSSTASTTIRPIPTEGNAEIPLIGTPSGGIRLLDNYMSVKPWEKDIIIRPTVTPEPITLRNVFRYYSRAFVPSEKPVAQSTKVFDDVLITTKPTTTRTPVTTEFSTNSERSKLKDLKDTLLSVDDDDDFKESLEVDEVFSLPPSKPDSSSSDSDEVTVLKAGESGWYGARWPFVDTSSYFQWTGYSPGDNLLLPLLVAALSSIALVLLLALAVRRRKRAHTATAQIGLTAELQADDNTNLLTAENPDDAEAEE
ncbi:uncharacterized protein LOC114350045 isoform X2 [Ostrinia furnacalis]|uniref:uncharacterized protein LOC114350045 isoform X2 n=1 Tax=Ostrinia furnacalis TaxID=93504 RepID=UPI00103C38F9|nr:uncharacterized protein LOC114350045 isoform X2 [Ostrinia furnacalis]